MMLAPRRIVYVGCVLAGKMYSLLSTLQRAAQPIPERFEELRQRPHRFVLTRAEAPSIEVIVHISDRRATAPDYDPTSSECEARIRDEIGQIASADGLIVVLDSRLGREEANLEAFELLKRDLRAVGVDPLAKPMVFQANKRDLPGIVPMDWVREKLRVARCRYVESAAKNHAGTLEAMRDLLVLTEHA